jgi:hypothetical protein
MPARPNYHLALLALAKPLRRYAAAQQREDDVNASYMLVHQALSTAFAAPPRSSIMSIAATLREHVNQSLPPEAGALAACA